MNNLCRFLSQSFMRIWLTLAVILWLGALSVHAEYYVREPGTCTNTILQSPFTNWDMAATNIQWAVNVATNTGDIVLVSNGVYTTTTPTFGLSASNIVALTNQIILKSVNGPVVTVIDGNYPAITARVVYVSKATLDGFTVRNGWVNYSSSRGGGIGIVNGTVTNCIVHNNYSAAFGGGISISSTGIVANCMIYSNRCTYDGGGLQANYTKLGSMVNNCIFWRNKTMGFTSGTQGGGGLHSYGSTISVKNCLFYGNDTRRYGGGICVSYDAYSLVLENCTITANTSTNLGGGFYMDNPATLARNSIIYNNSAAVNYADAWTTNLNVLTNSCIGDTNGVQNWDTSGNITNNPQFVDAATNNYRLMSGSPCINAGLNQSWMTDAVDLDGGKRIFNGIVDIGAYEYFFQGTIYSVR